MKQEIPYDISKGFFLKNGGVIMKNQMFEKEAFKRSVNDNVKNLYRKTFDEASKQEIFQAVSYTVKDVIIDQWIATQHEFERKDPKILYYMSMEFLMGRALGNNLINLTCYNEVKEALEEMGVDLNAAGSGTWKRWSWKIGGMFLRVACYAWLSGVRMRNPLSLWNVPTEN